MNIYNRTERTSMFFAPAIGVPEITHRRSAGRLAIQLCYIYTYRYRYSYRYRYTYRHLNICIYIIVPKGHPCSLRPQLVCPKSPSDARQVARQ